VLILKKLETIYNDEKTDVQISQDRAKINKSSYNIRFDEEHLCIDDNCEIMAIEDVIKMDNDIIRVELQGFTLDIQVIDPILSALTTATNNSGQVQSIIAGVISKINVEVDQLVEKGDTLIIISAMKMENQITSPMSGKITSIEVSEEEQISAGQLLVTIKEE
jgi:biotin carboxyl carrier protein